MQFKENQPTQPKQEGESMPKKEKPAWNERDVNIAEQLLAHAKLFDPSRGAPLTKAALKMGYSGGYRDHQLDGVRAYLRANRKEDVKRLQGSYPSHVSAEERDKYKVKTLAEDFHRERRSNPDFFIASTHPEDADVGEEIGKHRASEEE